MKPPAAPVDRERGRSTPADVEGVVAGSADAARDETLDGTFTSYLGWTALGGGAGWLAVVGHLGPSPFETSWAKALLLLAPMVLVPLILGLVRPRAGDSRRTVLVWRAAVVAVLPAALALVTAYARPQGPGAAALAAPWLAFAGILACLGLARIVRRLRRDRSGLLPGLAVDAGLVYLAVGGAWALLDRSGARPLGFEPVIVLLTAIHFHYAGLCLPLLTGLAGREVPGRTARFAAAGAIAGVPMVAAGITATQLGLGSALEAVAAWITALAGLLTASLHLRLASRPGAPAAARALWALAGVALGASMVLAGLYGSRMVFPVEGLDIPRMRALHGSANAIGFALAGVLGWVLAERSRRRG